MHIDLDRFKQVNDAFGHAAGDTILKRVTKDIKRVIAPGDFAARIGGDEFVLILTDRNSVADACALAKVLIDQISVPLEYKGRFLEVGASVGLTQIPAEPERTIDELLLEADLALYDAKSAGRGLVRVFSVEMQRRETLIREMTRDIGPALESGAFVPFFQIQVDTHTKTVFGVEVLGRWLHPRHGVIAPKQFLYVAERARLTEQIDRSIYLKALDHFAAWRAQGIGLQHISFNVTGRALADGTFLTWFENALRERGLHPSDVVLELVETILLDGESRDITETAAALAEAGFRLAIDDFGTGHASIASLISVPVRLVKIDRTFVAGIHESVERTLLTKAIIDLSKQLNIEVLAEGVEARAERDLITSLGCPLFQGYFYGRPVPAAQVEEAIQDACWMLSTPDEQDDAKVAGPLRNAI